MPTQVLGQNVLTQDAQSSNISTKSLPTASYVKNVESDGWTQNYTWYDSKGRTIGTHSVNHLGGYTKTETLLDFAGIPQKTNTYHKRDANTTEVQVKERFVYNAQNMLLKHYHQVDNNAEELLAENSYNEKGQLTGKKVGNNLQSIDYTYNIRGWMTGINDPLNLNGKLFGYNIRYQNPTDEEPSPKRYNGNISEVNWRTASNQILKRYAYQYDGLNRLTKGTFLNPDVVVPQNNWNNEQVSYDLNGNIKTLKRNAKNLYSNTAEKIDDLDYKYSGNRLTQIEDNSNNPTGYEGGGGTVEYDNNGNMKTMPDKQIDQIGYNYLNLPNAFKIEGTKKKMIHLYRTDGAKLRKTINFQKQDGSVYTTITDYLDGFQYLSTVGSEPNELDPMEFAYEQEAFIDNATTEHPVPVLSFFPTAEGFYDYEKKMYIYQYKDHLGNVRVSYKKGTNGLAEITDQNDYYPFGMNILREEKAIFGINSLYNYKYNGKELQETGAYDFGARQYMPDIGRWIVVDPLAEKMTRHSPYNYAFNNPIMFVDPDGREAKWIPTIEFDKNKNGQLTGGHLALQMEKGDTAESLAKTLNIDQKQADKLFAGMQKSGESSIDVPESIAGPINEAITDAIVNSGDYGDSKNYNCFASAFRTATGEGLKDDNFSYIMSPNDFQSYVKAGFEKAGANEKVFGKTMVAFRGENESKIFGITIEKTVDLNHAATYLGTSKNGTEYTFSKNGMLQNPKIETTSSLKSQYGNRVGYWNKSK